MPQAPAAPLVLIRDADVFAPEPLGRRQLLTGGGRILWIGGMDEQAPTGLPMQVVDLQGRRLVPGLIDGHVHITGGGGESGFASRVPALPLSRYTSGGVTTVIGVLGTDDVTRSTRELVAGVMGLREEGLSAWAHCGGYHLPPATVTGSAGSDIAFIECLIGVGEVAISDHRSSQPTLDELLKVAAQAHVAGLMTGKAGIVHLHLGDGARGLDLVRRALDESELPARVFNPTHVNRRHALFEEALDLARRGCTIDITAFPVAEGEDAWSAADALQRYLDSDAPPERVTVSSDAGGCLACFDHEGHLCGMDIGAPAALGATLVELMQRGLALDQVLPAFTSNVARLLRLPRKGRVATGADADLVALDAQGRIADVMAMGAWHVRDGVQVRSGKFEGAGPSLHSKQGR
ncbi:MAG: beta-aspartyl-peptidase [Arenimonas sp.]|uniref:beta-aspartyl-peptidase n=1 Tax=Arenimonas sp. TaxID=1872635 RepID=UPI0025C3DDA5|nr:beta-aspartyl-peptidase [Arenimonas sp.]MBW8367892.1 beta-aspartyl-peptidase [Arenimonas sp.]